jgi:hypothetical protein
MLNPQQSSSSLYYINPSLHNCSSPTVGLQLCLPDTCTSTYTVQLGDECVAIAMNQNQTSSWQDIITWNAGIDDRCSNIYSPPTSPRYWGNVICVSAPGGLPPNGGPGNGTGPGNGDNGGPGGSGDGYADRAADPPSGATVAPGTTAMCGSYVRAESDTTCDTLLASTAVPINMFLRANKSLLSAASCSQDLKPGMWYCLHPVRGFDTVPATATTTVGVRPSLTTSVRPSSTASVRPSSTASVRPSSTASVRPSSTA